MIVSEQQGDLFDGVEKSDADLIVIPHVCNDIGAWGSGFVVPLGKKYPGALKEYNKWNEIIKHEHRLGTSDLYESINHENDRCVTIYNMVAQHGIMSSQNRRPLNYGALAQTMKSLSIYLRLNDDVASAEIHAPRFGSDRAGGDWTIIREMIEFLWAEWPTYIYYL